MGCIWSRPAAAKRRGFAYAVPDGGFSSIDQMAKDQERVKVAQQPAAGGAPKPGEGDAKKAASSCC